jgi:hypothetical protein
MEARLTTCMRRVSRENPRQRVSSLEVIPVQSPVPSRLRHFVYYSDDKIILLAQQFGLSWWQSTLDDLYAEGELEAGPVKLKAGWKPSQNPELILPALNRVCNELERRGSIGTFDAHKSHFYGVLDFYYGYFDEVNPPVLFLVGATKSTIVAVGGSQYHVAGLKNAKIKARKNAETVTIESDVATAIYLSELGSVQATSVPYPPDTAGWEVHVAVMYSAFRDRRHRHRHFEVLVHKEDDKFVGPLPPYVDSRKRVIIGSPIFIAMVDKLLP